MWRSVAKAGFSGALTSILGDSFSSMKRQRIPKWPDAIAVPFEANGWSAKFRTAIARQ